MSAYDALSAVTVCNAGATLFAAMIHVISEGEYARGWTTGLLLSLLAPVTLFMVLS